MKLCTCLTVSMFFNSSRVLSPASVIFLLVVPLCAFAQTPSAPTGFRIITSSGDNQSPSIPMNLQADAVSSSQIDLTWEASNDNIGLAGYRIIRNNSNIPGIVLTNAFSDTNLTAGTYTYTVVAEDTSGNVSGQSNAATAIVSNVALVSNENAASNGIYSVVENGRQAGVGVYTDREFIYTSVPSSVLGATYIKTANDDKSIVNNSFLTFDVNQEVAVYVAYDERILSKPAWLVAFADTGEDVRTNDTTLRLHVKEFAAGTVTLGGNEGGMSMYTVIIMERISEPKQCSDGLDNDGDQLIDFPTDPGCVSLADNNEFNEPNNNTDCVTGEWSLGVQPPASCVPYPNGLFAKKLPNAGSGGPINHIAENSEAIVQTALTDGGRKSEDDTRIGLAIVATPGPSNSMGVAMYYGTASDPIYRVTSCNNPGTEGDPHNPMGMTFHIPNRATFANLGGGDGHFTVWDQVSNKVLGAYLGRTRPEEATLPDCDATTAQEACPMFHMSWCSMADYSEDKAYWAGSGAGDSLRNAPTALVVRKNEWMAGEINHAVYMNSACNSDDTVFPARAFAMRCSLTDDRDPTNRPPHGGLFFLDYTDAQIEAMGLPDWKKPIIRALAHYGGYHGDTGGLGPMGVSRFESADAYVLEGVDDPLYSWLENQGIDCTRGPADGSESKCRYYLRLFYNIPHMTGPKCPNEPCSIFKHMHLADECVARGLAGESGGCGG